MIAPDLYTEPPPTYLQIPTKTFVYACTFLLTSYRNTLILSYMNAYGNDDWYWKLKVALDYPELRKTSPLGRSPITPVSRWQRTYCKARRVQAHHRGVKKEAIRSHCNYLLREDSKRHDDKIICEINDIREFLKTCDKIQPHYRVIIAPNRGDVLDMEQLARNSAKEVMLRFGEFEYAGVVHEKTQSNGRVNKHIHLIFRDTIGAGAAAFKSAFYTASAREATLQFEEKGLHYIPDPLDNISKIEAAQLERELVMGDEIDRSLRGKYNAQ